MSEFVKCVSSFFCWERGGAEERNCFPQVSAPASVAVEVPEEEEENNEDAESGNSVDDEDMDDLLHADMFKVLSDMLRSEALLIQRGKSAKFGYLPMMSVTTVMGTIGTGTDR